MVGEALTSSKADGLHAARWNPTASAPQRRDNPVLDVTREMPCGIGYAGTPPGVQGASPWPFSALPARFAVTWTPVLTRRGPDRPRAGRGKAMVQKSSAKRRWRNGAAGTRLVSSGSSRCCGRATPHDRAPACGPSGGCCDVASFRNVGIADGGQGPGQPRFGATWSTKASSRSGPDAPMKAKAGTMMRSTPRAASRSTPALGSAMCEPKLALI